MTGIEQVGEFFLRLVWPVIIAYVGYLHWELRYIMTDMKTLTKAHYDSKSEALAMFASQSTLKMLDDRITTTLNRIDDKLTRLLEREAN